MGKFENTNLKPFQPTSTHFNPLPLSTKVQFMTFKKFNLFQPTSPFYPPQFTDNNNRPVFEKFRCNKRK